MFLSDRVLVMATGPGRMVAEVMVDLPRPRHLDLLEDQEFFAVSARLTRLLHSGELAPVRQLYEAPGSACCWPAVRSGWRCSGSGG